MSNGTLKNVVDFILMKIEYAKLSGRNKKTKNERGTEGVTETSAKMVYGALTGLKDLIINFLNESLIKGPVDAEKKEIYSKIGTNLNELEKIRKYLDINKMNLVIEQEARNVRKDFIDLTNKMEATLVAKKTMFGGFLKNKDTARLEQALVERRAKYTNMIKNAMKLSVTMRQEILSEAVGKNIDILARKNVLVRRLKIFLPATFSIGFVCFSINFLAKYKELRETAYPKWKGNTLEYLSDWVQYLLTNFNILVKDTFGSIMTKISAFCMFVFILACVLALMFKKYSYDPIAKDIEKTLEDISNKKISSVIVRLQELIIDELK